MHLVARADEMLGEHAAEVAARACQKDPHGSCPSIGVGRRCRLN
jgi:hypothetical protein